MSKPFVLFLLVAVLSFSLQGRELFLITFKGDEQLSYAHSLREILVKNLSIPFDFIEIREGHLAPCRYRSAATPILHLCISDEKKMEIVHVDYALLRRFEIFQKDLPKVEEKKQ